MSQPLYGKKKKDRILVKDLDFLVISTDEKLPAREITLMYAVFLETALELLFLLRNTSVPERQEILVKIIRNPRAFSSMLTLFACTPYYQAACFIGPSEI